MQSLAQSVVQRGDGDHGDVTEFHALEVTGDLGLGDLGGALGNLSLLRFGSCRSPWSSLHGSLGTILRYYYEKFLQSHRERVLIYLLIAGHCGVDHSKAA